jgi:hypothetical protein
LLLATYHPQAESARAAFDAIKELILHDLYITRKRGTSSAGAQVVAARIKALQLLRV